MAYAIWTSGLTDIYLKAGVVYGFLAAGFFLADFLSNKVSELSLCFHR